MATLSPPPPSHLQLEPCGRLGRGSPDWRDYLVVSPLWSFRKSWVYCGPATSVTALRHTSVCDQMAVAFRTDRNGGGARGFHCVYHVVV